MKKPALTILFLIFTIVLLSILRTYISNRLSVSGLVLGEIEDKITYFRTQNSILSEKLFTMSSLTNISSKAEKLGFTKENNLFLLNPVPLAVKQ